MSNLFNRPDGKQRIIQDARQKVLSASAVFKCAFCDGTQWVTTMMFKYDPIGAARGVFELVPTAPLLHCHNCGASANDTITKMKEGDDADKGQEGGQSDKAQESSPQQKDQSAA